MRKQLWSIHFVGVLLLVMLLMPSAVFEGDRMVAYASEDEMSTVQSIVDLFDFERFMS